MPAGLDGDSGPRRWLGSGPRGRRPSTWRVYLHYVLYLLHEFRWTLTIFWSLVLLSGLALSLAYHGPDGGRTLSFSEACYAVFMQIFLESYLDYPEQWYLQPLFFLLPIIGLGAVVDSLVRLAYLTFGSKQRLPEWHRMVASLYRGHVVVVGVGTVGYEIIKGLLALGEPVVALERPDSESTLLDEIIERDVPVVRGDGRSPRALNQAGVPRAKAVILATSNDLTNLDAGLTARDLSAEAQIVLRLFDESLAAKIRGAFAMPVVSTSQVSAPAFIAKATGRRLYQDFQLAGQHLYLIDLTITTDGRLKGRTVGEIQADERVNIVMHSGASGVSINPGHEIMLAPGDEVIAIAPLDRLIELENENQVASASRRNPTLGP